MLIIGLGCSFPLNANKTITDLNPDICLAKNMKIPLMTYQKESKSVKFVYSRHYHYAIRGFLFRVSFHLTGFLFIYCTHNSVFEKFDFYLLSSVDRCDCFGVINLLCFVYGYHTLVM